MRLPPTIIANSLRRFLSRTTRNALLTVVNALINAEGKNGVRLIKTAANYVWEIDRAYLDDAIGEGGAPGTGSLNWRGVWDSDVEYAEGDIVIRQTPENMAEHKTGTFVSKSAGNINNEPPVHPATSTTHWDTLAAGAWHRLRIQHTGTAANGHFDALGGRVEIIMDEHGTAIDFGRQSAIPEKIEGLVMAPMVVSMCDLTTGELVEVALGAAAVIPEDE
jgi:hypothetical protein